MSPATRRRFRLLAAPALLAAGCTTSGPRPSVLSPPARASVAPRGIEALLDEHPCPLDQPRTTLPLTRNEHLSIHLVQLREREPRHVHVDRDLTVFVHKGTGSVMIRDGDQDRHFPAKVGDVFHIPRDTPHFAVPNPPGPLVLIAVFSPPHTPK